jgi:hypothetical protein
MGLPITGAFARATQGETAPYAGTNRWGNGINPIHAQYQGPPRPQGIGVPNDLDHRTPPASAAQDVEYGPPWGAPDDDPSYADSYIDNGLYSEPEEPDTWPNLGEPTGIDMGIPSDYPAWNESGEYIRSQQSSTNGPRKTTMVSELPTETVSEGWINKGVTGHLEASPENDAEISDPSQYIVQTSMVQRKYGMQQLRMRSGPAGQVDEPRSEIAPRMAGPKIKNYSGGLRHYDMFPRQIDDIPRPFYFRTGGVGPGTYMLSNAQRLRTPLQRTPPPDPSQGVVDTSLDDNSEFGYTSEDWGY